MRYPHNSSPEGAFFSGKTDQGKVFRKTRISVGSFVFFEYLFHHFGPVYIQSWCIPLENQCVLVCRCTIFIYMLQVQIQICIHTTKTTILVSVDGKRVINGPTFSTVKVVEQCHGKYISNRNYHSYKDMYVYQ